MAQCNELARLLVNLLTMLSGLLRRLVSGNSFVLKRRCRAAALSVFHRYLAPGSSFAVRRVAALLVLRNHEEGIRLQPWRAAHQRPAQHRVALLRLWLEKSQTEALHCQS